MLFPPVYTGRGLLQSKINVFCKASPVFLPKINGKIKPSLRNSTRTETKAVQPYHDWCILSAFWRPYVEVLAVVIVLHPPKPMLRNRPKIGLHRRRSVFGGVFYAVPRLYLLGGLKKFCSLCIFHAEKVINAVIFTPPATHLYPSELRHSPLFRPADGRWR